MVRATMLDETHPPVVTSTARLDADEMAELVARLPHLLWSATGEHGLDYLGPTWADFVGEDRLRAWRDGSFDVLHPDDGDTVRSHLAAGEAAGHFRVKARLLGKDGEYRLFDIGGRRAGDGPTARWYGSCTDISTEDEAVQRLTLERAHWELLTESSPGVTVAFEPLRPGAARPLNITYASGRCAEILGFTSEHVLTHPDELRDRMNSDDLVDIVPRLIGAASDEPAIARTMEYDTRYDHPTLGERIMESRAAGAPMPDGSYRWQVTIADVTDRRALDAALHGERERALVTLASIGLP